VKGPVSTRTTPKNVNASHIFAMSFSKHTARSFGEDEASFRTRPSVPQCRTSLLYTTLLGSLLSGVAELHAGVLHIPGMPCVDVIQNVDRTTCNIGMKV
jgi:hypothetical protein